ncbi:MAG: MarR family transcriptional regulator [Alphaproteobacteria bacterium]|nr:MarR family transcriptional regulator [Alphaproteobacteria bacterium]
MKPVLRDTVIANEAFLIHEVAKYYVKHFDTRARKLGLTRSQWRLLRTVRRNPGIRQTDLAEMLEIAPMSLVHLLDRMEKKKWCRRETDKKDKRVKRVYLDSSVEPYTGRMRSIALDIRKNAIKNFTRKDHDTLVMLLQRLRDNLSSSPK